MFCTLPKDYHDVMNNKQSSLSKSNRSLGMAHSKIQDAGRDIPLETMGAQNPEGELEQASAQEVKKEKCVCVVVVAGMPRSGKLNALNNIFGADFISAYSAFSVTQSIETRCLEGDEDVLIVMETPGLGSTDIPLSKVKRELLGAIGDLNCVLVFCHSVSPGHTLSVADVLVVKKNYRKL